MIDDEISDGKPARGPLHDLHLQLGARMVPFAGYEMPVQYREGIIREHLHTRRSAGLFDVSHMGQVILTGTGAAQGLEQLVPSDIQGLAPGQQRYTVLTNSAGGVIDDLMVTRMDGYLFLIVNAACKQQDIDYLEDRLQGRCEIEVLTDRALLALQGPKARSLMKDLAPAGPELKFMQGAEIDINGVACFLNCSGYTGEDGFEISVPAGDAESLARQLLSESAVLPIGLGARDTLRLEAGLCLYGHELDESTSPVEAALEWVISPSRREAGSRSGGFPGDKVILQQLDGGTARKRVGLLPEGRAPIRQGADLLDSAGGKVGVVTSGVFGATVGSPVAMGYVEAPFVEVGSKLQAVVRGRSRPVNVCALPMVPHRYYRGQA